MDLGALDLLLARGRVETVVATAGTTGLGAIDPVHEILAIARSHGVAVAGMAGVVQAATAPPRLTCRPPRPIRRDREPEGAPGASREAPPLG